MARLIWTGPALGDLDAVADYIALENPRAAEEWVKRVFRHVEQLVDHPDSGSRSEELAGRIDKSWNRWVACFIGPSVASFISFT